MAADDGITHITCTPMPAIGITSIRQNAERLAELRQRLMAGSRWPRLDFHLSYDNIEDAEEPDEIHHQSEAFAGQFADLMIPQHNRHLL